MLTRTLRAFLLALCALSASATAQQPARTGSADAAPQPGVVVVSYNKCAFNAPARIDSLSAVAFFPVLDELVRERRLMGWGVLGHAWGDEWNYVIYYTAADLQTFDAAWRELVARVERRDPGLFGRITPLCSEHRDNIYSVRRLGASAPAPAPR